MKKLFNVAPLLLLLTCGCGRQNNYDKHLERPCDIWIFRSVMDERPRMITIGLNKKMWLSYGTETGSLYKAWSGSYTGNIFTDGEQPRSAGVAYCEEPEGNPWRLVAGEGKVETPILQYKGHVLKEKSVTLLYELSDKKGNKMSVEESPEYFPVNDSVAGLERIFRIKGLPAGYHLQLIIHPGALCQSVNVSGIGAFMPATPNSGSENLSFATGRLEVEENGELKMTCMLKEKPVPAGAGGKSNPVQNASRLIELNDCGNCHNKDVKTVGPPYTDIAKRYNGIAAAPEQLALKIIKGGSGNWGNVPMTPHPDLHMHEALKIVEYILQLQQLSAGKKTQLLAGAAKKIKLQAVATTVRKKDTVAGDRFPLQSVHPAFTLEQARPPGFMPRVAAMDFLPDGRLLVCTWDSTGAVYLLNNIQGGDATAITVKRIAFGLAEVLGMKVVDGEIYVLQKQELTRLVDTNGDDIIDEYRVVSNGWKVTSNFHEFAFGLVYKDGYFYGTLATALKPGGASSPIQMPGRGCVIRISKKDGSFSFIASGLRTPNGIATGTDDQVFITDNQGDWLPANKLVQLKQGAWYGSRAADYAGTENKKATPPVVYLQQDEIANSPSQPAILNKGIYANQIIYGDVTHGGIKRVFVEKINGQYQGCVFRFTQGLEAGVNRLLWGPDGKLYVGGCGQRGNWAQEGKLQYGLQRLTFNANRIPFEMLAVRVKPGGLEIEFTQPVAPEIVITAGDITAKQWWYLPTASYGGPKMDEERLPITHIDVRDKGKKLFLQLEGMKSDHVVYLRLNPQKIKSSNGELLWATETWYTLNSVPGR